MPLRFISIYQILKVYDTLKISYPKYIASIHTATCTLASSGKRSSRASSPPGLLLKCKLKHKFKIWQAYHLNNTLCLLHSRLSLTFLEWPSDLKAKAHFLSRRICIELHKHNLQLTTTVLLSWMTMFLQTKKINQRTILLHGKLKKNSIIWTISDHGVDLAN